MLRPKGSGNPAHKTQRDPSHLVVHFWKYATFGVFCVVASVLWIQAAVDGRVLKHSVQELLHLGALELGIGFLVSFVVSQTIDKYMEDLHLRRTEEIKRRISRNVFQALFDRELSQEMIAEMYRGVFISKFMRKNLEVTYEFSPGDDPLDELTVKRKVSFEDENIADVDVRHSFQPYEYLDYSVTSETNPFESCQVAGKPLDVKPTSQDADGFVTLATKSTEVAAGGKVAIDYSVVKKRRTADTETWTTRFAATGLRIRVVVNDDDLFRKLKFTATLAHRAELKKEIGSATAREHVWTINRSILPYRGLMLHWRLAQAPAGSSAGEQRSTFEKSEVQSFAIEDQLAGENIARLLSIMFLISLCLASGVCLWTMANLSTGHDPQLGIGSAGGVS